MKKFDPSLYFITDSTGFTEEAFLYRVEQALKGGATFLGLTKPVVKGHGNSKARGFSVCIAQAAAAARGNLPEKIKAMLDGINMDEIALAAQTVGENA